MLIESGDKRAAEALLKESATRERRCLSETSVYPDPSFIRHKRVTSAGMIN